MNLPTITAPIMLHEYLSVSGRAAGNVGSGVVSFFYEPYRGIVQSPEEFGKGLATGTKALVVKLVYGVSLTASALTGSLGRGFDQISPSVPQR